MALVEVRRVTRTYRKGEQEISPLRDLSLDGPRKFQDFLDSLSGISPNTLSGRLKALEKHGVVERRFYEEHPPRAEYVLTSKGRALRPVVRALHDWGERHTR